MTEYSPPEIWQHDSENGGKWAHINRPTAGAAFEANLERGTNPLQLHSLGTPNGQKVTVMLEELVELGITEAEYDAFMIDIGEGHQFSTGFVALNPNSKIPALYDVEKDTRVFESSSILLYLAEKFGHFLPTDIKARTEAINWLFWSHGGAPFVGGGFGHFYAYAPTKQEYPINRYTMETKRQLDVLDKELNNKDYLAGDDYSIADIAAWAWYGQLVLGRLYKAGDFLQVKHYDNVVRWAQKIAERPAVLRGVQVNTSSGLRERHSPSDFK